MFNLRKKDIRFLYLVCDKLYTNEYTDTKFKKILNTIYGKDCETKEMLLELIDFTCIMQETLWDNSFFIWSLRMGDINKALNKEYDKRYAT